VGALLARNEAGSDRYLRRVLANAASYCDALVVLDDGSTDDTRAVCERAEKVVAVERVGESGGWWGAGTARSEAPNRKRLWQLAREHGADWIYVFDADHELLGIAPQEFRALTRATLVDCWAFPLWDCWDREDVHRVDGYWQAWRLPRPWLFKALDGDWGTRAIHVGHCPWRNWNAGLAPSGAGIRHLSYVRPEHRLRKLRAYLSLQEEAWTPSSPPLKKPTPVASAT
jgi:glycosyltransferase involved in cell wall biosynthesis